MDPTLKAFLLSWEWRLDVIVVLVAFATLYTVGWVRLRRKKTQLAKVWRLVSYYSGLMIVAIALMSGFDTFQTQLFFVHMAQHLLLVMYAPPLIYFGNPMPFIVWALPGLERQQIGRLLTQKSLFRRVFVAVTAPWIGWLLYTCTLWLWHDPNLYNAAIENDFIHDIEHLSFFLTAMLFWWHITDSAPNFHGNRTYIQRMSTIIAGYFANLALGVAITMSSNLIYTHYAKVPRVWGIEPKQDQTIGGILMWIPGGMMYLMILLVLVALQMNYSEQRARLRDKKRRLTQLQELPAT
jgi:putative membrane protein